jgi:hypothetical protein
MPAEHSTPKEPHVSFTHQATPARVKASAITEAKTLFLSVFVNTFQRFSLSTLFPTLAFRNLAAKPHYKKLHS